MKLDNAFLKQFHELGKGEPPAKKLSMLIRPAFVARPGKTLVWGDWSNIEARVLPWLSDSRGGEEKLDIFRQSDADPTAPDIYIRTGADVVSDGPLFGQPAEVIWEIYRDEAHPLYEVAKSIRQAQGKVPELSLGFGGGLGALQAMATNYGVYFNDAQGLDVVKRWRTANSWAVSFWGGHGRQGSYGLWGAINSAMENPGTIFTAGRVAYVFDRSYMAGTLFCALPCGRLLTYPAIKWEWREVEDKKTKEIVDRYQMTYLKGYSRSAMWYGKAAENITQAGAASVLRRTLKRLNPKFSGWMRQDWVLDLIGSPDAMRVVMHTHDEIVTECDEGMEENVARVLKHTMEANDDWDAGLPLGSEITTHWAYSKAVKGMEL